MAYARPSNLSLGLRRIASGSIDHAFAVDARLHEAFDCVARNPMAGHTRSDLGIPDQFRVWSVYSHGAQEKPEVPETWEGVGYFETLRAKR